jgi:hypothetical protein
MSLKTLSKKIQASGRGKDSLLVHMSPREVQGLQQLAKIKGGALTTNPETGLPEAGFLEDILPMVAAGAAIYFTAGAATPALAGAFGSAAPFIAGAGAGALIGGGSAAIQGGDVGQGALMGGIGGLASAGMGSMMGPTPTPTGAEIANMGAATGQAATINAPVVTQAGVSGAVPPPTAPVPGAAGAPSLSAPQFSPITPAQAGQMTSSNVAGLDRLAAQQGVFPEQSYQLAGQGLTAAPAGPLTPPPQAPTGGSDLGNWWAKQSPWEKAGYSTLGAGLVAGLNAPPRELNETEEEYTSRLKRISPNFRAQEPVQPNPYYKAQYPTYAAGGPVERMSQMNTAMNPQGGLYPQGMIDKTQYALPTQRPTSMEVIDAGAQRTFAKGGIADLGGYSDGGRMLKGPGDGMSDSIPGVIANKQPARLADGEFVVPADVVSHLGNGSTDAGAKRLYSMMDKVRKARTGKKKQAPAINMNKYLPA